MFRSLFLCLGLSLISLPASSLPIVLDQIAAIVDDDIITRSEVAERAKAIRAQAANPDSLPSDDILTEQIVERLVVESLQLQMARRAGVRVSDAELNEAMARIASQNKLSLEQFRQALTTDGISYRGMRQQIEREIMIGRVQQGVMNNRIEISEQAIDDFLSSDAGRELTADEYRVGHILLATHSEMSQLASNAIREQAEDLVAELNAGADFQTLAMARSAGKNALEGGDLGWRKPGALPTLFSDLVTELSITEVRGPIQSGSGFHIIKLLQKRGAAAQGMIDQTRVRHVLINPNEIRSLEEAEALCQRIAMLKNGKVVALDRTDELLKAASSNVLRFKLDAALPPALAAKARLTGRIVQLPAHDALEIERHLAALREAGLNAEDVEIRKADLEDVFLDVMHANTVQETV